MPLSDFPNGITSFGNVVYPGGINGLAWARGFGQVNADQNGKTKVLFVDKDVDTSHQDYRAGEGDTWRNAGTALQTGINRARYNYGTTTINYDDEQDAWVIVAPGDYTSEGRIAWSAKNFHLIGLGIPGADHGVAIIPSSPSSFACGGSGSGVEIANIYIGTASAVSALYWQSCHTCYFHDIVIYGDGTNSTYGMYIDDMKNSVIERCRIGGNVTAGIYVTSTLGDKYMHQSQIRWNNIMAGGTCTDGIKVTSLLTGPSEIHHNTISGATHTETIDVDATAAQFLVAENWCYGTTSAPQGGTQRNNHTS